MFIVVHKVGTSQPVLVNPQCITCIESRLKSQDDTCWRIRLTDGTTLAVEETYTELLMRMEAQE